MRRGLSFLVLLLILSLGTSSSAQSTTAFTQLDSALVRPGAVRVLHLSGAELQGRDDFPTVLQALDSLHSLTLEGMEIHLGALFESLSTGIETLNFRRCKISGLPSDASRFHQVRRLSLSNCNLQPSSLLFEALCEFESLSNLSLTGCGLETFPYQPECMLRLQTLTLANNNILWLDPEILNYPSLRILNLHGNPMEKANYEQLYFKGRERDKVDWVYVRGDFR